MKNVRKYDLMIQVEEISRNRKVSGAYVHRWVNYEITSSDEDERDFFKKHIKDVRKNNPRFDFRVLNRSTNRVLTNV